MDEKGLYNKYIVFDNRTGEPVSRRCFVLIPDPEKDPVAIDAIEEYARKTENRTLASDLFQWAARLRAIGEIRAAEEVVEKEREIERLRKTIEEMHQSGDRLERSFEILCEYDEANGLDRSSERNAINRWRRLQDGR